MDEMKELMSRHPLPDSWGDPKVFLETVTIGAETFNLAGFQATNADGVSVTGSAADGSRSCWRRAYYELMERTFVVSVDSLPDRRFPVRTLTGDICGWTTGREVNLQSSEPSVWLYSKSNGVAVGSDWPQACRGAWCELVERDAVLRSWWGQSRPTRIRSPGLDLEAVLSPLYKTEAYEFIDYFGGKLSISAVFAFPEKPFQDPLCYGFAARGSLEEAIAAAGRECLQRLAFLYGEEIPVREPEYSPSALYHQEFFLMPSRQAAIRRWLLGEHYVRGATGTYRAEPTDEPPVVFVDLTAISPQSNVYVVKALSEDRARLTFGQTRQGAPQDLPERLLIHPIA